MGKDSAIEWTDHTFNPWIGCAKVSEGCKNCYAEALSRRYGWAEWGTSGTRKRTVDANWKKPLRWNKDSWSECMDCGWRGSDKNAVIDVDKRVCPNCHEDLKATRQRVFCASLGDVFEGRQDTNDWLFDLGCLITDTPNLDWLLLTKRPENVLRLIQDYMAGEMVELWLERTPNLWIGASVENQEQADKRIPELLKIPAAKRFLSMEPMLGEVDLETMGSFGLGNCLECLGGGYTSGHYFQDDGTDYCESCGGSGEGGPIVDWVIVGGESGPSARPMNPKWVRSIRDQCHGAGVPFFFKQWGKYAPDCLCETRKAHKSVKRPGESLSIMFACGKKNAGRLLGGHEWSETP